MQHIYMYTYRLNTCREQYMVNIILCREHEMKTIITQSQYTLGLHDILHEIVMRIVSKAGSVMINTSPQR